MWRLEFLVNLFFTGNIPFTFTFPSIGFWGFLLDTDMESSMGSCLLAVLSGLTHYSDLLCFRTWHCFKSYFHLKKKFFSPIYDNECSIETSVHYFEFWLLVINFVPGSATCSAWPQTFCLHIEFIWFWTYTECFFNIILLLFPVSMGSYYAFSLSFSISLFVFISIELLIKDHSWKLWNIFLVSKST